MSGILLAALAAATAEPAQSPCPPGRDLAYLCGLERPEDILPIPGTRWLIASGFASGSGLKLVDTETGRFVRWYDGDAAFRDARAYPHCPGSLDPALFNARGISLRRTGPDRYRLHVVNHGGRESIEIFDVDARGQRPELRWRGCLPFSGGLVGNAVATFADGTVLATVLTRPGTSIADFVQGRLTGGVYRWDAGAGAFVLLKGTELPGANGLETSPDGRHFYVVAFGWHSIVEFDRRDTSEPLRRMLAPDFMPDNIRWVDGRLLAAGMRLDEPACGGLRKVVDGVADPMLCHRGYRVAALDPDRATFETIASGEPEAGFNGVSAAAIVGGRLWLGSYQADRLAYRPLR